MRNTQIFAGNSCPALTSQICANLGMAPGDAELTQFANGETSVRILTSVREKDVFIVQSGSPKINDTIMELLIMISACKGGSANKITAVLPYFPYSRQSKKKSHRGAITARMLANLLNVAGVKHVVTVDLHASQMQGFFQCPVDNLHAEPLIARWIRHNVPNWKEAVVVSKNAGGTKRVTSLADALKLNFGMVTTDRRRGNNLANSAILNQADGVEQKLPVGATQWAIPNHSRNSSAINGATNTRFTSGSGQAEAHAHNDIAAGNDSSSVASNGDMATIEESPSRAGGPENDGQEYNDQRAHEVTHARLVQGHIVPDDFPSPAVSTADGSVAEEDPMVMSHVSSFFQPEPHALGGSGDADGSDSEDDEGQQKKPAVERMVTLVGNVRNRPVFIVDDMIDKPSSWIAAAETVVKKGLAKQVYCIATHGVFGGDCLEQMQACDCIDAIIVTNSHPILPEHARNTPKLVVLDLSYLLAEAIRRNHYGESMSPLFQHIAD
ncbi:ribose phosphate diphosphokinase [Niveomyces insectorum RCEF 264]|uniref:Ribose-phosphate pyrophosphokinase 1 n=1 Tax=Niveomyces insectorum RCEF 264 TaxID=1081102 RepID=A0A162LBZ2_9HYPO|nr:ribose phosphate diphosphokinase [Niveomyces insectorum RCEF 264]